MLGTERERCLIKPWKRENSQNREREGLVWRARNGKNPSDTC